MSRPTIPLLYRDTPRLTVGRTGIPDAGWGWRCGRCNTGPVADHGWRREDATRAALIHSRGCRPLSRWWEPGWRAPAPPFHHGLTVDPTRAPRVRR